MAEGVPVPSRCIETVSGVFGRAYTRNADAIWFISAGVVVREIDEGLLVRLPVGTGLTRGPVGLMTRADAPETTELRLFVQAVQRAIRRLDLACVRANDTGGPWMAPHPCRHSTPNAHFKRHSRRRARDGDRKAVQLR